MEKYVISNNSVVHGSFGRVYTGYNRETNEPVAFKDIRFFDHVESVPSSVIRHLSLWREMEHSNIIRLLDILNVVQHGTIRVRLVFDYLDINLKKFMDTHSETAKNPHVIKRFLHQILSALAYCHSHNILHQNLKPQYLFIDSSKRILKLAFRLFPTEFQSAGVVAVPSNPQGFENLTDAVPNLESAGLDLLSKMLCTVPEQRITACDALKHPYFDDVVSSPIGYNFLSVFLSEVVLHQLQNLLT
ncbi:cell division control protein 2 homolog isoform X5 [Cornus florida]|uniref:cell division control protein 2 homolog isoform X5 n=1 Tax=Cornus florida TaxID=4283 RepID=UPI00289EF59E|nr:cell division control protein 2 homolog isoform X5 [Cornus florida]